MNAERISSSPEDARATDGPATPRAANMSSSLSSPSSCSTITGAESTGSSSSSSSMNASRPSLILAAEEVSGTPSSAKGSTSSSFDSGSVSGSGFVMKSLRLSEEGRRSLKCVACSRPSFNAQFSNSIESQLLKIKKWPDDISNSLLDECDLLDLRARIHPC